MHLVLFPEKITYQRFLFIDVIRLNIGFVLYVFGYDMLFNRARLFSKSSLALLQEFWNSSICLYEIKKKNLSKSTCQTGSFTCPGPSGSGKRRALFNVVSIAKIMSIWKILFCQLEYQLVYQKVHFSKWIPSAKIHSNKLTHLLVSPSSNTWHGTNWLK